MKCISFILIILCLCYQTKQQVVASTANIYALQTNTISTPNKYVSIAKAQQQGGYLGYDEDAERARAREWYKQQQELEAAKVTSGKSSKQGGIGKLPMLKYLKLLRRETLNVKLIAKPIPYELPY